MYYFSVIPGLARWSFRFYLVHSQAAPPAETTGGITHVQQSAGWLLGDFNFPPHGRLSSERQDQLPSINFMAAFQEAARCHTTPLQIHLISQSTSQSHPKFIRWVDSFVLMIKEQQRTCDHVFNLSQQDSQMFGIYCLKLSCKNNAQMNAEEP